MYYCTSCRRDFWRFKTPGQCPLCGVYADVRCQNCSFTAAASIYITNHDCCPQCGQVAQVPGSGALDIDLSFLTEWIAVVIRMAGKAVTLAGHVIILLLIILAGQIGVLAASTIRVLFINGVAKGSGPTTRDIVNMIILCAGLPVGVLLYIVVRMSMR